MNPLLQYKRVQHGSSSADDLAVRLHDRALRDLENGLRLHAEDARTMARARFMHAAEIFAFLGRVLDRRVDPQLVDGLHTLYVWAARELATLDPQRVRAVKDMTVGLRNAWTHAIRTSAVTPRPTEAPESRSRVDRAA